MINDQILNELWAVMEENPDNPDQLRVIADRYMEIHYGFEKFANGLRWAAQWNRVPYSYIDTIKLFLHWNCSFQGIKKTAKAVLPLLSSESERFASYRSAYEFLAFVFQMRSEDQIRVAEEIITEWESRQLKVGDKVVADRHGRAVRARPNQEEFGVVVSINNYGTPRIHVTNRSSSLLGDVLDMNPGITGSEQENEIVDQAMDIFQTLNRDIDVDHLRYTLGLRRPEIDQYPEGEFRWVDGRLERIE